MRVRPEPATDRRDDRGLTLVVSALVLVIMLIFAAFAVDVGAVYNERRQDQAAADAASLAAVRVIVTGTPDDVVAAVRDSLNANLGTSFTNADLATCASDTGKLPVVLTAGGVAYDCITTDTSQTQVRVRVPERDYETAFAGVIGIDVLAHSAMAIAEVEPPGGFGGVLPFALTSAAGTGQVCVKTGPSGLAIEPCTGPSSGNFGFINLAFHGSAELGTTASCSGNGTSRVAPNIAMGADHLLSLINGPPHGSTVVPSTASPCGEVPRPNAAQTRTGNIPNILGEGLFSGSTFPDGQPARLQRLADQRPGYFGLTNIGGRQLDDNPLWAFIDPALTSAANVPDSCLPGVFDAERASSVTSPPLQERMDARLADCFSDYVAGVDCAGACDAPVFARDTFDEDLFDIQLSPRFAYVPVLNLSTWPSGASTDAPFLRFRAVFIQRVCVGQPCGVEFDPGVGFSAPSATDARSTGFTAWAFPDDMLPGGLGAFDAPLDPANNETSLIR